MVWKSTKTQQQLEEQKIKKQLWSQEYIRRPEVRQRRKQYMYNYVRIPINKYYHNIAQKEHRQRKKEELI